MHQPSQTALACLNELRETGLTLMPGLLDAAALKRLRAAAEGQIDKLDPPPPAFDDRFGLPNAIAWSPDACRAITHADALWVIRSYLGTDDIHFCHQPSVTVLRPALELIGQFPEMGWHSDYPYHRDVFPEDRWDDDSVYGVQFNICVDEFRDENGGTQYVPGSHQHKQFPPREFNEGGTRMGVPPHHEVKQLRAPAGAALIYDSRTWHRACPELNLSGKSRMALLNAVAPAWVRPMADKTAGMLAYNEADTASALTSRQRQEITALCGQRQVSVPPDSPELGEKQLTLRAHGRYDI
ncbi:MAG: phytanoyl-CoA dioxygenase family protein [Pseudomonadales bacterium]